jgi:ArsR family transcriptional regulator, arsenate/arsenite/antimonite-responsive transcriptional repressor
MPMSDTSKDPTDLLFRALASRPRREILRMLACAGGQESVSGCCGSPHDVCACTFSEQLGLSAATVSHHMTVLRDAGLVTGRKDGLWVYYRIRLEALDALLAAVSDLCPTAPPEPPRPGEVGA